MALPKQNLTELSKSRFIKVLMPERKGYGYEDSNPIETHSPHGQINFIRSIMPNHKGITKIRLLEFARDGAYDCTDREGFVDKYELAYAYEKDGKPYAELYELYFTFYPKRGESQNDFLRRTMTTETQIPEGLKRIGE